MQMRTRERIPRGAKCVLVSLHNTRGLKMAKKMGAREFFKWLLIELDSWPGWDQFTQEDEAEVQKLEWFEVSEHMEIDYSGLSDEFLEVELICLCCGVRPELCVGDTGFKPVSPG